MARRLSERLKARIGDKPAADRVAALTALLRESGVEVESESTDSGFAIREHNCPFATTVAEHPEICGVIHSVMQEVVAPQVLQTESIATGGTVCRFEITSGGDDETPESPVVPSRARTRRFRIVARLR
jgi:predicted ArsR family transcriptional regulator